MTTEQDLKDQMCQIFNLTSKQLEIQAYRHFLEEEQKNIECEIIKIGNKHGINDLDEMLEWFEQEKLEESEAWEDFFELDRLEHKRKMIQTLLNSM
jgi:hypothetical protein